MIQRVNALATSALMTFAVASAAAAQDVDAGERVFRKCGSCHQLGENARDRAGPVLNGIVGAAAGQREGFEYSSALIDSGLIWDEATLSDYLRNPRELIPGNRMSFAGLRNDDEIADVIAYVASFQADGTQN